MISQKIIREEKATHAKTALETVLETIPLTKSQRESLEAPIGELYELVVGE
jgi:hypothetical protein